MDIKTLPHQKEFLKDIDRSKYHGTILVGGFGSGKSEAGVFKTFMMKLRYPKHKVAYYLPTYGLVRDIAFDKFTSFLESIDVPYRLNKSDKELLIPGYSSIIFRTMSEPENIIGYETAYSLIDEADILPKDKMELVYNKIVGRNRSIDDAEVDMVSTPEGFKFLYDKVNSGQFKVIRAKTSDNKFVPDSYVKSLEDQYTPELLKAYLEGEFVNLTSGSVYNYFDRDIHTSNREGYNFGMTLHIGQDFNVGGCCSVVCGVEGNAAYVIDEFTSKDTYQIVENIKEKYPGHHIVVYPDASGSANKTSSSMSDIDILYKAGFEINVPRKNGAVKDRINAVQNKLSKNTLYIDRKCLSVTKALEQQVYDKNGVPEKSGGAATVDDWNDALGYFIVRKFGIEQTGLQATGVSYA